MVCISANERRGVTSAEWLPIDGFQRFSEVIVSGWGRCSGTNIQLYAFRLMAGCKPEPNSVGSRWTSGYASHHASRAVGKLDTFAAIGHYTRGAS
jgi:hypothetical protein